MPKITLDKPWTYRTPEKTINYPSGAHEVFQYIADQAEADGVIPKDETDGDTSEPATTGKTRAARKGQD